VAVITETNHVVPDAEQVRAVDQRILDVSTALEEIAIQLGLIARDGAKVSFSFEQAWALRELARCAAVVGKEIADEGKLIEERLDEVWQEHRAADEAA
jgi:hypothetical protein